MPEQLASVEEIDMDRLQAMQVFTKVVELNGFSRAADALELPHASATTIIKNLEAHLQVRLMHRTTRRLSLTPEGADYYERCLRILADISETEEALAHSGKGPRGKLRVDMPGSIGKLIVIPKIAAFREKYPDIDLMIGFGDRQVDLIQEGVDCAVRVGQLQDSSLVSRRLGNLQTVTVASPAYIGQFGLPIKLTEAEKHHGIQYFSSLTGRVSHMNFTIDHETIEVKVPGTLYVNDAEAAVLCCLEGCGLIQAPRFMVATHLLSGALVEVLPRWKPRSMPIAVVYPHNRHLAGKVRVFVEWLTALFEQCPLMAEGNDDSRNVISQSGRAGSRSKSPSLTALPLPRQELVDAIDFVVSDVS